MEDYGCTGVYSSLALSRGRIEKIIKKLDYFKIHDYIIVIKNDHKLIKKLLWENSTNSARAVECQWKKILNTEEQMPTVQRISYSVVIAILWAYLMTSSPDRMKW